MESWRGAALAKKLKEHGFTALLVHWNAVRRNRLENVKVLAPEFLSSLGREALAANRVSVYLSQPQPEKSN